MYDDAGDAFVGSADVSDIAADGASFDATGNDELYDASEGSGSEVTDDYSAELTENHETDADTDLFETPQAEGDKTTTDVNADVNDNTERFDAETEVKQDETEAKNDRSEIYENSEYSNEVNDRISSKEELDVYQNAELKEENVDGRTCLVRDDIDMDYVDPKSGMTNRELMEKGRAPYDAKTGERIELHHIGQEYESPFAELTADSEHGQFYSVLHTKESESWRNDEQKANRYNNVDRPQHWKARAKED